MSDTNLKAQWGNPPKPNLWKVNIGSWGKGKEYVEVTSPLLGKDTNITLTKAFHNLHAWDISFNPPFEERHLMVFSAGTFEAARDAFLGKFGWQVIKDGIKKGEVSLAASHLKVAATVSNLKAMWGDPPKPNLWEVREHNHSSYNDYVAVKSPLLKGDGEFFVVRSRDNEGWEMCYHSRFQAMKKLYTYDEMSFEEMREFFLSRETWFDIKDWLARTSKDIFLVPKVANSSPKLQWGDPPKPNVWKVDVNKYGNWAITSPLMEGEILYYGKGNGGQVVYSGAPGKPVLLIHQFDLRLSNDSIEDILKQGVFWRNKIKPHIEQGKIKLNVPKVASSKKVANDFIAPVVDIKLQWGDPPKPNLWRVTENRLLEFTGIGEKGYQITSPVMVGSIFLTFKQGSYSKLEYMERGGEVKHLIYLDKNSLENSLELIKSPMFWRNAIKRAIEKGTINLTVPKVASIASPNKKKVELQWGDPPKPNIWSVYVNDYGNWTITSPLMEGEILYIAETGRVFYRREDSSVLKIYTFGKAPESQIKHLLKSRAFWNTIKTHIILRGKVASSNL